MRLIVIALIFGCVACGPLAAGQPLGSVEWAPPALSPDMRDQRNRMDIRYHLNGPASLTSRILAADGREWSVATGAPRPLGGDYVLQFDGTVAGPGPNERRVLPDGDYKVILDVRSGDRTQQSAVPLSIRGADTSFPEVTEMALLPDRISPNFDAQDDVTHMTYTLAKDARVSAFLDGPSGRVWRGEEVQLSAGAQSLTWDGLANGQPVPNGSYTLGVRARDQAGNVVEVSRPLVVENSGVPDAAIVSARIGPLQITRGSEVCLDAIVRNTGQTVLRTQGPDSGYVYNSLDAFGSIEDHALAEHAGYWRVGLNWSGGTDLSSATYPYRWGFGRDLQPGEEASVHGCVRVLNDQDKIVLFAGLIQENVAIHSAGAGLVRVQISS